MYINRCISITVLSVCSHKFARRPLNTLYRNSVCVTATPSVMLSWCYEGLRVVAASAVYSCHHTFTIYLQKNEAASYPTKGPLGSIPRLKAASLLGAASSHLLYRVYRNKVTALYRLVLPDIRKASGCRGCDALLGEWLPTFRRLRCLRSSVSIIFVQQNPSDCRQYVLWKRR